MSLRAFAPGRVNLIGEHTDYNDGLCLPFAVELGITVAARPTRDGRVHVHATDLGEEDAFPATAPPPAQGWRAYPRGVVAELAALGVPVAGVELTISSTLPAGAGMSSSAALGVGLILALAALAERELDDVAVAELAQRVEHRWVGANTGLLDQLACLRGREGQAVRLDMRTLDGTAVSVELEGWTFAVLDSGEIHELAASGYNARRDECASARAALGLASLRDAGRADADRLPEPLGRRVRHILEENDRVEETVAALDRGDGDRVGRLLDASHASLRDLYEVSTPQVDATVQRLLDAGAAGARVMGGGFGGSALALFAPGRTPPADAIVVAPAPGARIVANG